MGETKPGWNTSPEDAQSAIAEICRRTKCAVVGDAVSALAAIPGCLESFLSSMRPAFDSCRLESAARWVRDVGAAEAESVVRFSDHLRWLADRDYSQDDTRQIRYIVEAFCNVEPVHAVLAASAEAWLDGATQSPVSLDTECVAEETKADFTAEIRFVDGDGPLACLSPFDDRWGSPRHSFLRALAIWPPYVDRVWAELDPVLESAEYARAVSKIREGAERVSREMPISAIEPDLRAQYGTVIPYLKQCLNASCHVLVVCSALRSMFVAAEIDARSRRSTTNDS